MADMRDVIYHGIRQQIRRVLQQMSDEQLDRGIDAFETGASTWAHCFFARALNMEHVRRPGGWFSVWDGRVYSDPVQWIMVRLAIESPVPIKLIYQTFDGMSHAITRKEMKEFITSLRDERRPDEVMALLRGINYDAPIQTACAVASEG